MTELTDNELNKRVREIMGLCQHSRNLNNLKCKNCGVYYGETDKINFNVSWIGFGLMWEFMQRHERWEDFCKKQEHISFCYCGKYITNKLISPRPFAEAMVNFFEETKP